MKFSSALLVLTLLTGSTLAQEKRSEPSLKRPVIVRGDRATSMTNILTQILSNANVPGGIATVAYCGDDATFMFSSSGPTLEDALEAIVRTNPQIKWTVNNSLINVFPFTGDPALLKTVISRVEITKADTVDAATQLLLSLPQVKSRTRQLKLSEGFVRIGPSDLRRPGSPPVTEERYKIRLSNVTLREALNALARANGRGVWEYRERHCNGKNEFQVHFLVR